MQSSSSSSNARAKAPNTTKCVAKNMPPNVLRKICLKCIIHLLCLCVRKKLPPNVQLCRVYESRISTLMRTKRNAPHTECAAQIHDAPHNLKKKTSTQKKNTHTHTLITTLSPRRSSSAHSTGGSGIAA